VREETPTLLGLLERVNINHWASSFFVMICGCVTIDGVWIGYWIYWPLATTSTTSAIANLHNLQHTTVPPRSSAACCVLTSRSLVMALRVEILQSLNVIHNRQNLLEYNRKGDYYCRLVCDAMYPAIPCANFSLICTFWPPYNTNWSVNQNNCSQISAQCKKSAFQGPQILSRSSFYDWFVQSSKY
jgi:hypothetical protein